MLVTRCNLIAISQRSSTRHEQTRTPSQPHTSSRNPVRTCEIMCKESSLPCTSCACEKSQHASPLFATQYPPKCHNSISPRSRRLLAHTPHSSKRFCTLILTQPSNPTDSTNEKECTGVAVRIQQDPPQKGNNIQALRGSVPLRPPACLAEAQLQRLCALQTD